MAAAKKQRAKPAGPKALSGSAEAALSFVPGSLVVPAVALAWKLWGPGR